MKINNKKLNEKNVNDNSIGIFSSASDVGSKLPNRVMRAKQILENHGYKITLGKLWNKSIGYTTSDMKDRASEFNALIKDNKILMSMIGGMNSSSILPYINYNLIKKKKTKIIGYSDTTAILLAIYNKTKIPTYYGPALLPSFDEQEYIKNWNLKSLDKIVHNNNKILENPEWWTEEKLNWFDYEQDNSKYEKKLVKNKLKSINDGIVTGRLIGGNLDTFVSIYHTEYMPKIKKGDILFIEDSYKSADQCERNFAFLRNSGILDLISGVIIGKCEHFDPLNSNETYESLFLKFLKRKIPVLMYYDCSHCLPMNVLKIGATIKLDTYKKEITILD